MLYPTTRLNIFGWVLKGQHFEDGLQGVSIVCSLKLKLNSAVLNADVTRSEYCEHNIEAGTQIQRWYLAAYLCISMREEGSVSPSCF